MGVNLKTVLNGWSYYAKNFNVVPFQEQLLNFLQLSAFYTAIYSIFDTIAMKPEVEIRFLVIDPFFFSRSVSSCPRNVCAKFCKKRIISHKVIKEKPMNPSSKHRKRLPSVLYLRCL